MGLAGTLSLYLTQVLPLPHDNWAILTVLVMMTTQYTGSIAVKAILRTVGTIAGGIVGVWLVGDYTSSPIIFLPLFFLVLAITSYKYGQYGARQVPYAYYLLGLTTLSVVTNGIATPDQVWQVGIDRTEEILLGVNGRTSRINRLMASFRPRRIRHRQPREPRSDWRADIH